MKNVLQADDNFFNRDPIEFIRRRAQLDGDFTEVRLFGRTILIATSWGAVREMLRNERSRLCIYDQNPRQHRELFGDSVFSANGRSHVDIRDLLAGCLLSKKQLILYLPRLVEICEDHVLTWQREGVRDLLEATRNLTTQICAEVLVGIDDELGDSAFRRSLEAFMRSVPLTGRGRWLSSRYLRGKAAAGELRRLCEQRMRSDLRNDTVLGQLVRQAPDEAARHAIPREIVALLVAAQETTAVFLLWTIVEISLDSERREAVRAELAGGPISPDDLLDRTRQSAMRTLVEQVAQLHSPNMLALRLVRSPFALGERRLAEGSLVAYSPSLNSLSMPQLHRYVTGSGPNACPAAAQATESLAFGFGIRACPGKRFGELVAAALAAVVVRGHTPLIETDDLAGGVRFLPLRVPNQSVRLVLKEATDERR